MISNIPKTDGAAQSEQHVISLQTAAASKFTGWTETVTYCVHGGVLYGGGAGEVFTMLSGLADDADGGDLAIKLRAQQAWNNFGTAEIKHMKATRPRLRTAGAITYGSGIGVDFVDPAVQPVASTGVAGVSTLWVADGATGVTPWGDTAATTTYWSGTTTGTAASTREWRLNAGRGVDFSYSIALDIKDQSLEWLATDYKIELVGARF